MAYKMSINRLLENSQRSDVRGYNIYTRGLRNIPKPYGRECMYKQWDKPSLGLPGTAAIGHQVDVKDLIIPAVTANGVSLCFEVMRNHWTPAYMDTHYRCKPFGEYQRSGLVTVQERKCFTGDDTFISHLIFRSDSREDLHIEIDLNVPFEGLSDGIYKAAGKIVPRSVKKEMYLEGFACAKTSMGTKASFILPAQGKAELRYGFAFSAASAEAATYALDEALTMADPFTDAEKRFNRWMADNAPALNTDDTDMLKVYYYRFFVIKCAIHTPSAVLPQSDYVDECVYESPFGDWFGAPVGLPIPLQIEEMKWMREAAPLRAFIANWCRGVGATKGYIQYTPMAIWNYYMLTGDKALLEECYGELKAFALKKCPDSTDPLPITVGSWVTGAEYQPSFYQYTEPKWDWQHDNEGSHYGYDKTSLYRVDECVMHCANLSACEKIAKTLGNAEDAAFFAGYAGSAIEQLCKISWNEEKGFFFDVDVNTGKQCDEAYCYDGFLPMSFDLVSSKYSKAFQKLQADGAFDSGFGITSVNKDNPMYWFDNHIAGPVASSEAQPHGYACCWNGPVWPFAVSLVLDALGTAARKNSQLNPIFERIFRQYTELHFSRGDRSVPLVCEHFRPSDGMSFSPYTEYFHSQWVNLYLSYYLGIRVNEDGVTFAPITQNDFAVDGVMIRGKAYRFSQEDGKCCMTEL